MLVLDYLKYQLNARDAFSIHSPFVFEFYNKVLLQSNGNKQLEMIELQRKKFLNNHSAIEVSDFGAGTQGKIVPVRRISEIARRALIKPKYGRLLYQIAKFYECKNMLELGTSLGIGSAYLASSNPAFQLTTIEGCPNIASIANETIDVLDLKNVKLIVNQFDNILPVLVKNAKQFDLVYIDGNHRSEAMQHYFTLLLPHLSEKSMVVFDDIYWNSDMKQGWENIKQHPSVSLSIDVFQMGIVFFHTERAKQHFTLKY
jgi:predicted O-methyltransferase YrrM